MNRRTNLAADTRLQHAVNAARMLKRNDDKARKRRARQVGSLIYFIQAGDYVKVGISSKANMRSRLFCIRINCPFPARILKVLHTVNPREDERVFHDLLEDYHVHGEWFRINNSAIMELLGVS